MTLCVVQRGNEHASNHTEQSHVHKQKSISPDMKESQDNTVILNERKDRSRHRQTDGKKRDRSRHRETYGKERDRSRQIYGKERDRGTWTQTERKTRRY